MSKQAKSPLMNREEFAQVAKLSLSSVDAAIRLREVPTITVGKRELIERAPVEAAIQEARDIKPAPFVARLLRSRK